ncbi:right-handed parallel beta-helix repeat-containing protein [Oligoflexus tunisiensis]|uniref:right-handed parallel beta-helix repeat-containing protein n=1 Tax=Oligoflexus tunisiensis TaxID=708132 RepID=UPI00159F19E7|nr:right-handed parallel beta-helix repeat-containing protein [Oligoflexus tunisiensis]
MGNCGKVLLVCLVLGSGCKLISSSFRGKHSKNTESPADPAPATSADGTSEQPNIPQTGPTVPEESFQIPEPAPDVPLEGNVVRRPSGGIEISGAIGGIWDKKVQPVYVVGDITLKSGKTLVVKEGVQVLFDPNARFYVEGAQLKINGTAAEPVLFTSLSPEQTWQGIRVCSATACETEEVKGKVEIRHAIFERARKADLNPNDVTWRRGGVFNMRMTETIIIEDTIFQNNFSQERGGAIEIIAENPNIIFRRNMLRDNSNEGGGGALQITHGRNLKIEQNTFINNSTKAEGGAIAFIDSAAILLSNNVFENNRAEQPGGAIACDGHGLTINIDSSNVFKGNVPNDKLCKEE